MLKPFVILFIVTTNLCTLLDSYKIINDQQDSPSPHEEYIADNYSNEDSYTKEFNGRVVIGKWRNNGEALEPKWRDGDSVPLAPFSTISFKNGWMKQRDSQEEEEEDDDDDHQISELSENPNDNENENAEIPSLDKNRDSIEKTEEENRTGHKNSNLEKTGNDRPNESKPRIGYRNSHRSERQFDRSPPPTFDQDNENSSYKIRSVYPVFRVSSILREQARKDDTNGNIQGPGKYRETLENHPNEYELFENENDDPRPRKRRPPEHHEFPGSTYPDNKREGITQSHESNVQGNDLRRYSMTNQDRTPIKIMNVTKSQENIELKTFLKMQGNNLSLSEILQQKNLTLSDLLRGKPNAINILKSNDKKFDSTNYDEETSTKKSTFTETPADRILPNLNSGNSRWSNRRKIMIRKLNASSTLDDGKSDSVFHLNLNQTNFEYETTTSRIIDDTTTITEIKETDNNISSSSSNKTTTLMNTDEKISLESFKHIDESPHGNEKNKSVSHEFLKRLENRESLITESTTAAVQVQQDGTTEYPSHDHPVSVYNDKFLPANNDNNNDNNEDDEIMEFSDYPASKMPKFIAPMIYESKIVNNRRKNVPFSAIRMNNNNPVEDPELKLNIENILTSSAASEKKLTTNINETNNNVMEKESNKRIENEREEKKEEKNLKPMKNENESVKSMDLVNETGSWNRYEESLLEKEKDLTHHNHKLHEVVIPKIDPQSRAEILELFSSGSSAERLERLLASRNMTIEELIALRQRGSSQVHFAEVFKAKEQTFTSSLLRQNHKTDDSKRISEKYHEDKKTEAKETTEKIIDEKMRENDDSTNIEETKNFGINKNDIENKKKDTFATEAEYLATDLFKLFSENKNSRKNFTNFDKTNRDSDTPITKSRNDEVDLRKTIENSHSAMTLRDLPAGNNIQRDSEGEAYYTSIESVKVPVEEGDENSLPDIFEKGRKLDGVMKSVSPEEIGRVEEILNNDLKSIKTSYGINDYEFSEKKALSKVKPSIIASGGILGVTVVVFLSIFIACRIQQKKKFAYKNSFAKAVFHNPVMAARKLSNTSSINTIMVDVVATSTTKRPKKHDAYESDDFESKSEIDNDSLDANDSWDTIPDFMK